MYLTAKWYKLLRFWKGHKLALIWSTFLIGLWVQNQMPCNNFISTSCCNNSQVTIAVKVDATKLVTVVDERFLSVGIAPRLFKVPKWEGFNITSPRLINMVKELSPGYLRIGGTSADEAFFIGKRERMRFWLSDPDWVEEAKFKKPYGTFAFSSQDWIIMNNFAAVTNMSLIFNFNAFLRRSDFSWDSNNAKKLLTFSSNLGYRNLGFQLGNEPNSYTHAWGIPGNEFRSDMMTGNQVGDDFSELRNVLGQFGSFKNSTGMQVWSNGLNYIGN